MQLSGNPTGATPSHITSGRLGVRPEIAAPARPDNPLFPRSFSESGIPETEVWRLVELLIQSNRCQVTTGEAFARPVTGTHPLAAEIVKQLSMRMKPNLPLTFAYEGTWDLLEAAGDAFLELGNHPAPRDGGMVVLKSATQSLQQVLHLYRTKYYAEHGIDLNKTGLLGAADGKVPRPVVLAAVNNNLMLSKAVGLLGFGKDDIALYNLDESYQADVDSLIDTIHRIHSSGRRVVAHVIVAGDAERGVAHDARTLDCAASDICAPLHYRPPAIIDAAAQWLNLLSSDQSSRWDLRAENENIKAVIFDPQKTELPYDLSLLLLRDYKDLAVMIDPEANPHPDKRFLLAQSLNILSRGGESAVAAYFYLLNQGLENVRRSRTEILTQSRRLAEYLQSDSRYRLISEPQGSVVAWRVNDLRPIANWEFVQRINAQENDRLLLTYNQQCRVTTIKELERSLRGERNFDGIVAHFMEHNTAPAVDKLIARLRDYRP